MRLTLIDKLGDGGFADVWRAKDELDRIVAVKIVRAANKEVSNALAHAKALARAEHKNVVTVFSIEKVEDPESTDLVDCVVMELISGVTLNARLTENQLTLAEVQAIGLGIIEGLQHIHSKNLVHGDLHAENVMVVGDTPKIIDILYRNSLASLSTEKKDSSIKRDFQSLQFLLNQLLDHSNLTVIDSVKFNMLLKEDLDFEIFKSALLQITDSSIQTNRNRKDINLKENIQTSLINPERAKYVHPSYIEIANNLTVDEVNILSAMAKFDLAPIIKIRVLPNNQVIHYNIRELVYTGFFNSICEHHDLINSYLVNLERLGLVRTNQAVDLLMPQYYSEMLTEPTVKEFISSFTEHFSHQPEIEKCYIKLTSFGHQFCSVAIPG